ncbi:MAG: hypothetical protein ACYTBZ_16020 [Planctomycetota bacterium]|jgi:hypothetical protein
MKRQVLSIANKSVSRREVLLAMAGTCVAGGCAGPQSAPRVTQLCPGPQDEWPVLRVAYLRPKGKYWLGWPGTAWEKCCHDDFKVDTRSRVEQYAKQLNLRVVFEPEPLYTDGDVDRFCVQVKKDKPDGVLVFPLHMDRWGQVNGKIAPAMGGRPLIIFAPLGQCFTGHIQKVSKLPGVYLASCADFNEMAPLRFGMKLIRTQHDIRRSKIAVLTGKANKEETLEPLGLKIKYLPREHFIEVLKTIEVTPQVKAIAREYRWAARKVVEPTWEDLINASKNYFAARKIMKNHGCQGISLQCLQLVRDRQLPCPPCMAWSKLLDMGIPGVCEADVRAVMGETLCCRLLDKPGFIQDPVPNTVNNTLIGAHCVSPTRLNGFDKPREPFNLRTHAESDVGVSFQVLWRPGQEVTVMQFTDPGNMILGKGTVLRNLSTPPAGGCRTSVEVEIDGPPDTRDTKGFHQLFIYGDHVRDFQAYAQMYGIKTEHI